MYVNARAIIERERPNGTEVLLQIAERPGEPSALEFPGGRLEEFEPIVEALRREVLEETGLHITQILDEIERTVSSAPGVEVECLRPFFVYQTTTGPVDSVGFFFRCHAEGIFASKGDAASGYQWVSVSEAARRWRESPGQFHWLTNAALAYYLKWRGLA